MFASFCSTEQPAAATAAAAVTFRWNSHATDPIPPRRQEKTQISTDAFQIFLVKQNAPHARYAIRSTGVRAALHTLLWCRN